MTHDFKRFPELANSQMDLYYFESPHKQIMEDFEARVVKVTDGDTIRVTMDERDFDFPVRMIDIDAPELEEGGLESAKWLRDQILGQDVNIIINPRKRVGKWGRLLGDIIFAGESMGEASMREGHSVQFGTALDYQIPEVPI